MAIPIVTFLFFLLASMVYFALKETILSRSPRVEVRSNSFLHFLPFALVFIGLFSSTWLTVAATLQLGQIFSDAVLPFSQTINEFIMILASSLLLFGVWTSFGYLLPKWLAKHRQRFTVKGLSRLFPNLFTDTLISAEEHSYQTQNIIEFSGKDVGEIATHRTDLTVLQIDATLDEVFSIIQETEFTRIPVYDEDIDQIAGILHVKDFFHSLKSGGSSAFFSLKNLLRPASYVRMNQEIDAVFKDMRERDYSIAIVLDEFGGTYGLITLEDIIRDITKDLLEEQRPITAESKDILPLSGNRYLISGSASLFMLEGTLGVAFPINTPHQTLDGFLSELIGQQSDRNKNTVHYKHLLFTIQSVKDNQIESVIVAVHDEEVVEHQFIG
ncbi:CBS domain-containing protein [Oceanobacillus sp. CFH 90083]|uniref:CBS domain-containing protein n=1 Tax=Oceanobacillus sp. CFH 90083 TaxID=2592336 RepID=UPI00128D158D|nr:CBS domain-containing protein [Oceanobacillus sp. CFH 90083]